jgi:hypothetical protein
MKSISLCEAKCKQCATVFGHAHLGDLAYGKPVLSTASGRRFLPANSTSEFAQKLVCHLPVDQASILRLPSLHGHEAGELGWLRGGLNCLCRNQFSASRTPKPRSAHVLAVSPLGIACLS